MSLACCAMNSTILKLAGNTSCTVSAYNPVEPHLLMLPCSLDTVQTNMDP